MQRQAGGERRAAADEVIEMGGEALSRMHRHRGSLIVCPIHDNGHARNRRDTLILTLATGIGLGPGQPPDECAAAFSVRRTAERRLRWRFHPCALENPRIPPGVPPRASFRRSSGYYSEKLIGRTRQPTRFGSTAHLSRGGAAR